jgi:hypothetical protein
VGRADVSVSAWPIMDKCVRGRGESLTRERKAEIMRNIQLIAIVGFSLFMIGVVAASAASAEVTLLAEWLVGGKPISTSVAVKSTGTVDFTDSNTLFGSATVACSGDTGLGTIGPDGTGEVTSILNSAGHPIEAELKGEGGLCEGIKTCEKDATETEGWPLKLPVLGLLFLLESGNFTVLGYTPGSKGVGAEFKCLVLGTLIEDTCSTEDSQGTVINNSGKTGVEATGKSEPGLSCTEGTSTSGSAEAVLGNLSSLETGTEKLSVSSEGAGE